MKYVNLFLKHFSKTPAFSVKDVSRFLLYNRAGKTYPKRFINNMVKRGKIFKISKGVYTIYSNTEVIGFAFSPFYYGLTYALSYYNIWEERSNPVILTTRTVRIGQREAMNANVSIFRLPRKLFFGYTMVKGNLFYYPVSDLEKTFIDVVYFNINLRKETIERLLSKLNKQKLHKYLSICPEHLRREVLDLYGNLTSSAG